MMLYHVTSRGNLAAILQQGITPTSYWAIEEVCDYYAEDFDDPITFGIDLSRISDPIPDQPGIDEPVTFPTMGKREAEVHDEWENSNQTWRDSLEIVGSIACRSIVHVTESDIVR